MLLCLRGTQSVDSGQLGECIERRVLLKTPPHRGNRTAPDLAAQLNEPITSPTLVLPDDNDF